MAFRSDDVKPETVNTNQYFFPVYMAGDMAESINTYADAIIRFDETILKRQAAIKTVFDSLPELAIANKSIPTSQENLLVYRLSSNMMMQFNERNSRFLDTLLYGYAFLGNDTEQSVLKAMEKEESRKKRKAEEGLPKATRDKEGLLANAKADPDAQRRYVAIQLKEELPQLVLRGKAFYLNELGIPVFADTLLLSHFSQEKSSEKVANYMMNILVLRSAYPDLFEKMNEEIQRYVMNKDWYGLFHYAQEKGNPLSENNAIYLAKHKRVFGIAM